MYKHIIIFAALILVFGSSLNSVNAIEFSRQHCLNSTIAYTEDAIYNQETGELTGHYNETMICDYGCFKGECLPSDANTYDMSIVIGLMLVAFFFVMTGLKMDKDTHGVIQVLFLFIGMLFVIITMAVISELADYSGITAIESAADAGYLLSIYAFWFVVFWFIILLFYKLLVSMGKLQPIKWSL